MEKLHIFSGVCERVTNCKLLMEFKELLWNDGSFKVKLIIFSPAFCLAKLWLCEKLGPLTLHIAPLNRTERGKNLEPSIWKVGNSHYLLGREPSLRPRPVIDYNKWVLSYPKHPREVCSHLFRTFSSSRQGIHSCSSGISLEREVKTKWVEFKLFFFFPSLFSQ